MRALVTGSCGLVGYSACKRLLSEGWDVTGVDNDQRSIFFGKNASTSSMRRLLEQNSRYHHYEIDIRCALELNHVFNDGQDLVIHCAAQPSHDWAATHVEEDFFINAVGTLNLLQIWKSKSPTSPFIHVSTSKVYGDGPNTLSFQEESTRWDLPRDHSLWHGIPEGFSVDQRLHSFFGVSKLSGDLLAQEYGRNFGLPIGIFRPGCITGGHHRGAELHGFLAYLMKCVVSCKRYSVYGYKGKQVRCNVHSDDLVEAFMRFASSPKSGEVYNIGGRGLDCSVLEAIKECENRCGHQAIIEYVDKPRTGDHIWWISDARKLSDHYGWKPTRSISNILDELWEANKKAT